jgi:hypothetical protein
MAGPTLCVSSAQLPVKDGALAVKTKKCPECGVECGTTSYGATFRLQARNRRMLLSPLFITGVSIGAGLFTFVIVMIGFGMWSKEKIAGPVRPSDPPPADQLARVKEVAVGDPFPRDVNPTNAKASIKSLIEQIRNANNGQNKDAFVLANMERRPELRGMPFIMGNACRLDMNTAQSFHRSVEAVRNGLDTDMRSSGHDNESVPFWNAYLTGTGNQGLDTDHGIAALNQVLGPERQGLRASLVQRLANSPRPEATRALAKAAVFEALGDIRRDAIKALKNRNNKDDLAITDEVLMHGLRYPLAAVSQRAADAMVMLARKDMLPKVAEFFDEPPPGDPVAKDEGNGCTVREVVRINHHRNCLLCHPPATMQASTSEVPGVIPIPGMAFPSSPKDAYGQAQSTGEPMVRADTTYLRQDFSVMMPVANAHPWPEMQRFDFLVRTRELTGQELAAKRDEMKQRPANFLSENHKAAQFVLEELTGRRNVAATRTAWQEVLAPRGE